MMNAYCQIARQCFAYQAQHDSSLAAFLTVDNFNTMLGTLGMNRCSVQ
jgi:hypothetical protein